MPDASFVQASFLGGEWSPYAQGRIDHPKYRTAMALCLNAYPVEEGAAPRRQGFAFCGYPRNGGTARVLPFNFTDVAPFEIEVSNAAVRVWQGRGLVYDSVGTVVSISAATPMVFSVTPAQTWTTGDQVQFLFNSVTTPDQCAILRNRQFAVTKIGSTGTLYSIVDAVTGATVNGNGIGFSADTMTLQVARIATMTAPYVTSELQQVRSVQAANIGVLNQNIALLLHGNHQPEALEATLSASAPNFSTFTLNPAQFLDGPYLDPVDGATMTPNATTGTIQLTMGYTPWSSTTAYIAGDFVSYSGNAYVAIQSGNLNQEPDTATTYWEQINAGGAVGPNGFVSTDVGRAIRLLSEPSLWNDATDYAAGQAAKFNDVYYIAQSANVGIEPDTNLTMWLPTTSPSVYTWTWGAITNIVSSGVVDVVLYGPALLYTQPILAWQIGAYSDTTGWPTCGCYSEGRLWLGGAIKNRVDSSNSNDFYNFAPTNLDGTVGDANSISATFDSDDAESVYWMEPVSTGIAVGTKSGEWLLQADTLQDGLTPTTTEAHRNTRVGSYNQIPVKTPLTLVFIHKLNRMLFELFPDVFSGKMTAPNLNIFSKHLTTSGVEEIAYQSELAPIIWARVGSGQLVGWTYRRTSAFANQEPEFVGAHQHELGNRPLVESICVAPSPDQTYDSLFAVVNNPVSGIRHLVSLTKLNEPTDPLTAAMFVDDGITPAGANYSNTGAIFYGLWHLNGTLASVVVGGLDCGDFLIQNGQVSVPWQSDPGKLFTYAYLQSLAGGDYGDLESAVYVTATTTPATNTNQIINEWLFPQSRVMGGSLSMSINWPSALSIMLSVGSVGHPEFAGYRLINMVTGNEISEVLLSVLNAQSVITNIPNAQLSNTDGFFFGNDGYLYVAPAGANSDPIFKINPLTWTAVAGFGQVDSGFTPGTSNMPAAQDLMQVATGGVNYLVVACDLSAFEAGIALLDADTMTYFAGTGFGGNTYMGPLNEDKIALAEGHQGTDYATVYALGQMYPNTTLTQTHLYEATVTPAAGVTAASWTGRTVGAIAATTIDPQWTEGIWVIVGPVRDPVDGNLIVFFGTDQFVPNTARVVKISIADASIMWNTPVSGGWTNFPEFSALKTSRLTGGLLGWIGGGDNAPYFLLNTTTGQINTGQTHGITLQDNFGVFDAENGTVTGLMSYLQGSGSPVPGPSTPTSFSTNWAQLNLGSAWQGSSSSTSSGGIPAVIGYTYTTQCQIVRPALPQEAGAANGPAQGKTRRNHMFSMLIAGAVAGSIYVGTVFTKLRPLNFKSPGGTPLATNVLYSGVHWNTVEDDYSFDGQLCWQVTRPLPAPVCNIGGFLNTQDR